MKKNYHSKLFALNIQLKNKDKNNTNPAIYIKISNKL